MCGAGEETSSVDKRELCWTTSQSGTVLETIGSSRGWPVENGGEASARQQEMVCPRRVRRHYDTTYGSVFLLQGVWCRFVALRRSQVPIERHVYLITQTSFIFERFFICVPFVFEEINCSGNEAAFQCSVPFGGHCSTVSLHASTA